MTGRRLALRRTALYDVLRMIADLITVFEGITNWQAFLADAGMVILSLVLIEGLLSVDNALGIAAMASHLPRHQQRQALRWGLVGAYLFRGIALAMVTWLMYNMWVKWLGSLYLLYLAGGHLRTHPVKAKDNAPHNVAKVSGKSFITAILSIELMDLSLSMDNVVAAVGLVNGAGNIPEELQLLVVCLGVFIGILALRIVAGWCIGVIARHPILSYTAFLLVGFVGMALVLELTLASFGLEWHMGIALKFSCIAAIVALTLLYESHSGLRSALRPFVRAFRGACSLFTRIVEAVIMPWRNFGKPH